MIYGCEQEEASVTFFKEGKAIYQRHCQHCHDNPAVGSNIVPAIRASSLDLLQSKVWGGRYPEGYVPKRETFYMPIITKNTVSDLRPLHAFLNNINEQGE